MIQSVEDHTNELETVARAYEREKNRRRQAENALETRSRELFLANEELQKTNRALSDAAQIVENQSLVISGLSNRYVEVTSELKLAAAVQHGLLPAPIHVPEIQAAGRFQPAHFIAGDGYDYHFLSDDIFAFYVTDVAGHGIASALISFAVQNHLKTRKSALINSKQKVSLEEMVLETIVDLNNTFAHDEAFSNYFTIVYGLIDLRDDRVVFCQAGHPGPIHVNYLTGEVSVQGSGGFPVGMFADAEFGVSSCQLQNGDRLVVYSDGATDSENSDGIEFGIERLTESVYQLENKGVVDAVQSLEDCLVKWQGSHAFEDDISILVIDYKGDPRL